MSHKKDESIATDWKIIDRFKNVESKYKALGLAIISIFGVFFLSGLGLVTSNYVGTGILGGQWWFFWTVVSWVIVWVLMVIWLIWFDYNRGLSRQAIRTLNVYWWGILFSAAFIIGLQGAYFSAFTNSVFDMSFTTFGNFFSLLWIIFISSATGMLIYANLNNSHMKESQYKIMRNYFVWMIALSLFFYSFEQTTSATMGINTYKILVGTNLGDLITSSLQNETFHTLLSQLIFDNWNFVKDLEILGIPEHLPRPPLPKIQNFIHNNLDSASNIHAFYANVFDKGGFWGINNNWQGYMIFITIIFTNISLFSYSMTKFYKDDIVAVDRNLWKNTSVKVLIFTIVLYSINAYIITFIAGGSWNPGIVGTPIGNLQLENTNGDILSTITSYWMFQIMDYPIFEIFTGGYTGTIWWWMLWSTSLIGFSSIISLDIYRDWTNIKTDYINKNRFKIINAKNDNL
ncbi:MAG: hypothetical protein GQ557_02450 [Mycoplasmataceae bacterium]|nr:hypothetical protein [Mycoplasmataceae bacterium]